MGDSDRSSPIQRELDTDGEEPILQLVEIIAELQDREPQDLSPSYDHLDHIIDNVFSNPPAPDANVEISFDYEGYRITVEQNGRTELIPDR